MIWSLDAERNFTFFNKRSEELTCHKLDNWIGKSFAPLIHEEELQKIQNVFEETMAGHTKQYEVTITKKDGSDMIISVKTVPVLESDEVVGTISFGRDDTYTRQTEETLEKYAEELARSNEELKSLYKMKDEFLSNVSHELKTPLISIKGFS